MPPGAEREARLQTLGNCVRGSERDPYREYSGVDILRRVSPEEFHQDAVVRGNVVADRGWATHNRRHKFRGEGTLHWISARQTQTRPCGYSKLSQNTKTKYIA